MKQVMALFFIPASCFLLLVSISYAIDMESSQYQLKYTNVNITSGNKTSEGYRLSDTVGQTAAGEFLSNGYIIRVGFQYLIGREPFRFTVSDSSVDLGTLTPNIPVTKTITLTVGYGSAHRYQVTAEEQGPLKTIDGINIIPDTNCNGKAGGCNELMANRWDEKTAYGFGYNLSGNDIPTDFINSQYFRPFPDALTDEPAVVVMANQQKIGKTRRADLTFKANISNTQPAGSYQTVISFVATPSY